MEYREINTNTLQYYSLPHHSTIDHHKNQVPVSRKPLPCLLPPCRICGEKASGFHYGVNSCEACKGFFRRSNRRSEPYKCTTGNRQCAVSNAKRTTCSYCRYQKCLALGMSKSAIKTGRYTHELRSRNIQEVKGLNMAESLMEEQLRLKQEVPLIDSTVTTEVSLIDSTARTRVDSTVPAKDIAADDFDALEDSLVQAQEFIWENMDEYVDTEKMRAKQRAFYERHPRFHPSYSDETLRNFESKRLPNDVIIVITDKVRLREELLKVFMKDMEMGIHGIVGFSKNVPGLKDLCLDDQAALVKGSRDEIWMFGSHFCFSRELPVYTGTINVAYDDCCLVWTPPCWDPTVETAFALQGLDLCKEEIAVLRAMCLTFPDRCELRNREKVEELHWKMVCCLRHTISKRHKEAEKRFAKIVDILCKIRETSEMFDKVTARLRCDMPFIQEKPLVDEIWFK